MAFLHNLRCPIWGRSAAIEQGQLGLSSCPDRTENVADLAPVGTQISPITSFINPFHSFILLIGTANAQLGVALASFSVRTTPSTITRASSSIKSSLAGRTSVFSRTQSGACVFFSSAGDMLALSIIPVNTRLG